MRTLFLVLALLTPSTVYAQPESATVYNAISNASVAVTGNVTCSEKIKDATVYSTASGELTFTNISKRDIVALEATASFKCMHAPAHSVQYHHSTLFFKAHGLATGESINGPVPGPDEEGSRLDPNAAPTPSRVDVEIQFVQFEDGSTWGDSRVIGALRVRRKNIESFLSRLASASHDQEFDSMLNATLSTTAEDPFVYNMAYKISLVRKESGTEAARTHVTERLRVAREREASGKF